MADFGTFGDYVEVNGRRLHVIRVEMTPQGPRLHVRQPADKPRPEPSPAAADDGPLEGVVLLPTWDQLTYALEPLAMALARLHRPDQRWECKGCDYAGCDAEPPDWPCETARLVLEHLGHEPMRSWGYGRTVVRLEGDGG